MGKWYVTDYEDENKKEKEGDSCHWGEKSLGGKSKTTQ